MGSHGCVCPDPHRIACDGSAGASGTGRFDGRDSSTASRYALNLIRGIVMLCFGIANALSNVTSNIVNATSKAALAAGG